MWREWHICTYQNDEGKCATSPITQPSPITRRRVQTRPVYILELGSKGHNWHNSSFLTPAAAGMGFAALLHLKNTQEASWSSRNSWAFVLEGAAVPNVLPVACMYEHMCVNASSKSYCRCPANLWPLPDRPACSCSWSNKPMNTP